VRPDGHVAWRGDRIVQPEHIVDAVRGAMSTDESITVRPAQTTVPV
jgi:hypothetical protein